MDLKGEVEEGRANGGVCCTFQFVNCRGIIKDQAGKG